MPAVSQTVTALTSSSYVWEDTFPAEQESLRHELQPADEEDGPVSGRSPVASQNGNSTLRSARGLESPTHRYSDDEQKGGLEGKDFDGIQPELSVHKNRKPRSTKDHAVHGHSVEQHVDGTTYGERYEDSLRKVSGGRSTDSDSDENSKWIHRDKLAKIESEELQAAGIILPRQRDRARSKSQNRPRRDQSQDKISGSGRSIAGSEHTVSRSRKNSTATTTDAKSTDPASIPSWDLRRPEEILEEGDGHWASSGSGKSSSRIPVAKTSPMPLPSEHLARDTRLPRKRDGSPGTEESITYPKTRSRSSSTGNALGPAKPAGTGSGAQSNKRPDSSPKKPGPTAASRKPKPANGAAGRPKTRGGPSKDSSSSGTARPSTKSGEREFSCSNPKPMEGEPPWMVSAYRPDPRLPPDQQLLPTVAKRLQQEKWEREGKFGSVYDKEFRPLTDEGFLKPPEPIAREKEAEKEAEAEKKEEQGEGDWPLKAEAKSPTLPARTNSYSTMPKISDSPANPLPSPRTPANQNQSPQPVRVPEPVEEAQEKKGGCACCIVM
ncbi:uncharacterized protein P884DRAFT_301843 [Thermothelomyces heterothallicus CBS 202.75]|uniref:uncharacterized protein n=1 Tax=Thermothelomyces heterothallicus CBS 202.75 TaxID=1149848 RepID=UPI0037449BC7